MATQAHFAQQSLLSSRHASYRLGLIDPRSLAPLLVDPLDAPRFTLLVPVVDHTFTSLLPDPRFQQAAIDGYCAGELDGEMDGCGFAPARVVNWIWGNLSWDIAHMATEYLEPDLTFSVGYILGALSSLAETDRALALVGIAHLLFLLPLVPPFSHPRLLCALNDVGVYHTQAVRAFRALVRDLKAQGMDFAAASHAALTGLSHLHAPYADGSFSNALPAEESEVA